LETWRGLARGAAGFGEAMQRHLERAAELASERDQTAARCETLALLALEAARLGAERDDEELLAAAERAAEEAARLAQMLPGHPPWGAQADAALARVALTRGDPVQAHGFAASAISTLESAMREDLHLNVVAPVASVLKAVDAPEWPGVREYLQLSLAMIAQRTLEEDVRVRWFRGPVGRELTELAGSLESFSSPSFASDGDQSEGDDEDAALLRSLIQGRTNEEIAEELGIDEQAVVRRLGELFARIGASSRAEATAFAFRERVV
jgi:DNA-binding CsgD family transcriptional regulator